MAAAKSPPASTGCVLPTPPVDDSEAVETLRKYTAAIKQNAQGNVERADLTDVSLEPALIAAWAKLPQLKVLTFRRTNVSDADLNKLVNLKSTGVTDESLPMLSKLQPLRELDLSGTQ